MDLLLLGRYLQTLLEYYLTGTGAEALNKRLKYLENGAAATHWVS
jgi:hypothetical protein